MGYLDENCDCSKWEFYEDTFKDGEDRFAKKEKGACFGYREYSWKEFKKFIPSIRKNLGKSMCFIDE